MIYQKLHHGRAVIKALKLKKAGWNKFSSYDYFTPEQINAMVWQAEKEAGLIHIFSLMHDCNGYHGELEIRDIETGELINFTQATEIPVIKASNDTQQIGGAVTYTLRYMLMTAYGIADNSLDFDADHNDKVKIPANAFDQLCAKLKAANGDSIVIGDLLKKARNYYLPFSNDQENIINQIID